MDWWMDQLSASTVRGCSLAPSSFVSPQSPLVMQADNLISTLHPIPNLIPISTQSLTRHWFQLTNQPQG